MGNMPMKHQGTVASEALLATLHVTVGDFVPLKANTF